MHEPVEEAAIFSIEKPDPSLWTYYLIRSLAALPLAPLVMVILWFRFHTMRYRFNPDGVSMSWGILFRREIILQYARIQDIHLRSNVVERWLGLSRVLVQTASGNASAEMTLEGLKNFEAVRDFLYSRMRGVKDSAVSTPALPSTPLQDRARSDPAELAEVLRQVAGELRELRQALTAVRKPD